MPTGGGGGIGGPTNGANPGSIGRPAMDTHPGNPTGPSNATGCNKGGAVASRTPAFGEDGSTTSCSFACCSRACASITATSIASARVSGKTSSKDTLRA